MGYGVQCMTKTEQQYLIDALRLAVQTQEKYEREELGYTSDSGQLAVWREMLRGARWSLG